MLLAASGGVDSIARLLTSLLIFVFVLFITSWTIRFVAKYQKQTMMSGNMEVVESTRIAPNKYLQIVRAGEKYFLIALGKDEITMIAELGPEQLNLKHDTDEIRTPDFKSILEKAKNSRKKQADKDE